MARQSRRWVPRDTGWCLRRLPGSYTRRGKESTHGADLHQRLACGDQARKPRLGTTSPCCARPRPDVTISVWPSGCVCPAVRAPGSNVTCAPTTRAGAVASNSESMRTVPVNHAAGPVPPRPQQGQCPGPDALRPGFRRRGRPCRLGTTASAGFPCAILNNPHLCRRRPVGDWRVTSFAQRHADCL
jgi:hypothetical protein